MTQGNGSRCLRDATGGEAIDRYAELALGTFGAIRPTPEDQDALAAHLGLEAARWINQRFGLGMPETAALPGFQAGETP